MPSWNSLNASPPSLLYPPDSSKWWMRRNMSGTQTVSAPNGKQVCIIELRGWLREIDASGNGKDPDWHYVLEVDLSSLDALGIALKTERGAILMYMWTPQWALAKYDMTEVKLPPYTVLGHDPVDPSDHPCNNATECRSTT